MIVALGLLGASLGYAMGGKLVVAFGAANVCAFSASAMAVIAVWTTLREPTLRPR